MAKTYVLSRASEQFVVTARDASGRATARHPTKRTWAPRLYEYITNFSVISARGAKDWALCVVDDGQIVPAAADLDPDIRVIPESNLDRVLTVAQRTTINTGLAQTDIGITAVSGATLRTVLNALGQALNHTSDFSIDRV